MAKRAALWIGAGSLVAGCVAAVAFAGGGAAAVTSTDEPSDRATRAAPAKPAGRESAARPPSDSDLGTVADRLRELGAGRGFAGLRVDDAARVVTTHWAGSPPREVTDYAKSRPRGVRVVVVEGAAYPQDRLLAAAERVTESAAGKDAGVAWASPDGENGAGLLIGVDGTAPDAATAARLAEAAGLPAAAVRYESGAGLTLLAERRTSTDESAS